MPLWQAGRHNTHRPWFSAINLAARHCCSLHPPKRRNRLAASKTGSKTTLEKGIEFRRPSHATHGSSRYCPSSFRQPFPRRIYGLGRCFVIKLVIFHMGKMQAMEEKYRHRHLICFGPWDFYFCHTWCTAKSNILNSYFLSKDDHAKCPPLAQS